jgi:hypothetical protein
MKPGRKKSKNPLNKVVQFRMTAKDFNRARGLARGSLEMAQACGD